MMAADQTPTASSSRIGLRAALSLRHPQTSLAAERLVVAGRGIVYSRANQMFIDGALVAIASTAAYLFRFDGDLPAEMAQQLRQVLPFAVLLSVSVNAALGVYQHIWRFFGLRDAALLMRSVTVAFVVSVAWRFLGPHFASGAIPLGALVLYPLFSFAAMTAGRLARRLLHTRMTAKHAAVVTKDRPRVLIAGAGEAGLHLLRELRGTDFEVVGFVDDDRELQGRRIAGLKVLGTTVALESLLSAHRIDEVILCMPSTPKADLQRLVVRCHKVSVRTSSVPTLDEVISGRVSPLGELRPISMEALLGRHSIQHPHDVTGLATIYRGRRILITGAGGSIGSELVRQLRRLQPSQLILLDKDENNLYEITCEIREEFDAVAEVIADIRSFDVMEKVFRRFRPEVVFHAAAYKHVPLMEHYPAEAILNNVVGTKNVAELSRTWGVQVFVLVSTDKAVNPSNTMGASKRVAEMIVQSLASPTSPTRFCCVRFGNVLGSRASVVPIFQRQIRQGKNITVTHPDVTRYFMTIPEAVQLVIETGALGTNGEIFMLDMGDQVKIVDLARNLIELSGLVPDIDISIKFTGLRPGEKLYEELFIEGEQGARSTKHPKIFVVGALKHDSSQLRSAVAALEAAAQAGDADAIYTLLRSLNIGYAPSPHDITVQTRIVALDGRSANHGSATANFVPAGNA
jgi:FlaA1/EpsC-like NDP-sugar epimerase